MAIQVQFITLVIPIEQIDASAEPGGFVGLLEREAADDGNRFWHDDHLYAIAFMNPLETQRAMKHWETRGLVDRTSTDESRRWKDLCVVDYYHGPTLACDWLAWDAATHSVWMRNTEPGPVVKPRHQHETKPLLITLDLMQKLGRHIRVVGKGKANKPWWKIW